MCDNQSGCVTHLRFVPRLSISSRCILSIFIKREARVISVSYFLHERYARYTTRLQFLGAKNHVKNFKQIYRCRKAQTYRPIKFCSITANLPNKCELHFKELALEIKKRQLCKVFMNSVTNTATSNTATNKFRDARSSSLITRLA